MNKKLLLIASAGFLGWSISHASISVPGWTWSGGIYCTAPTMGVDAVSGDQSVNLAGSQWSYGTLGLSITTDSSADPTMIVNNSINNTSPFVWTEYVVNVAMNQFFTIDSAGVVAPGGWTATITAPSGPDISGNYVGTIDYKGGTPVAIYPGLNSIFNFGYQITFSGSTSYSLTESANPVPEPGALTFLMVGGLLIGGWAIAKRRQAKLLRVRA